MGQFDNTHGAELIAEYAKLTGRAMDKSRADIITILHEKLNADVTDAFSVAHIGVARLIKEISADITNTGENVDNVYTSTTLIMAVCVFMQTQHNISVHDEHVRKMLGDAPENVIKRGVLLAATPNIKRRTKDIAQFIQAMVYLFMGHAVDDVCKS